MGDITAEPTNSAL